MLIDEIYTMESGNESSIHLIRDRKFFQAYEKSAFRFVKFLREYKVHHKFFKKIGADVVYLGFPDSVLENDRLVNDQKGSLDVPLKKLFVIYREFYDLTLYLCRLTSKFHRNFKFGLGDKLREDCILYLTDLQCVVQSKKNFERSVFEGFLVSMQIRLRLLMDLRQISEKQWIFVNQTIVKLQGLLGQNPVNQGLPERPLLESSGPLA